MQNSSASKDNDPVRVKRAMTGAFAGVVTACVVAAAAVIGAPSARAENEDFPTYTLPDDMPQYRGAVEAYNEGRFGDAYTQFRRLAELGHGGAEFMLGVHYFYGRGIDRDYSLAAIWFYKAARQGNPAAQLAFGSMFIRGVGVAQNLTEAYKWLTLARHSDIRTIADQADMLCEQAADSMTEQQIRAAEQAAFEFEPVPTGPLGLE